jgi:hypothetical protein
MQRRRNNRHANIRHPRMQAMGRVQRMSEGLRSRRRSRRGRAAALVLAALAAAGAVGSYATGWPFPAVGPCEHLVSTVRTSEPGYARGQTVIISVTLANEGPACTTPPQPCGPPPAPSAYDTAGEDVWDYGAGKFTGIPTCIISPTPQAWPAHHSSTQEFDWSQDECRTGPLGQANPNCPGTQVPAGTYRIVSGTGTSAPATITISG